MVERLATTLRMARPQAILIAGGIHPTLYPQHFFGPSSPFDFAVIGEGEQTLLELVQYIRSGKKDFTHIRGLGFRESETGRFTLTVPRPLDRDLDEISYPDYEGVDMAWYTTASPYAIRGVFSRSFYIASSRGCPSSCTFCVSKKLRVHHGVDHFIRLRSPHALFSEIRLLRDRYGIDSFYFIDDLFTLKKSNVLEFCALMQKADLPVVWGCSSRVNTVDYDILRNMKAAGCVQIDFGVEKGSDQALQRLKKNITIQQIRDAFRMCRALNLRTFANFIVNTPDEDENDLKDILALTEEIRPTVVLVNLFTPYPGCEIFEEKASKIEPEEYYLMLMDLGDLIVQKPGQFRFAAHAVDLKKWAADTMKKHTRIGPNVSILFDRRYVWSLLRSRHKLDYLHQASFLLTELINRKYR